MSNGVTNPKVSLMAGMEFILLGTKLTAGIKKTSTEKKIFINQDTSVKNEGVTIEKLIADVKKLMGHTEATDLDGLTTDSIKDQLSTVAKEPTFDINSVKVILKTVYLDITIPVDDAGKDGKAIVKYAFQVVVSAEDLFPADIEVFKPERLTFAVWNTTEAAFLKELGFLTEE